MSEVIGSAQSNHAADPSYEQLSSAYVKSEREVDRLNALVSEIANSGVEFYDNRVGYVTVQIDRDTWLSLDEWRAKT